MTAKTAHIHKLSRHKHKTGSVIYFCTLPDCNYKAAPALTLGKRSVCNRCGEPFILSAYAIRLSKPHCDNCHKPKEAVIQFDNKAREIISQLADSGRPPSLAERLKKVVNSTNVDIDEDEI